MVFADQLQNQMDSAIELIVIASLPVHYIHIQCSINIKMQGKDV